MKARNFSGLLLKFASPGVKDTVDVVGGVVGLANNQLVQNATGVYGTASGAVNVGNSILNNVSYNGVPLMDYMRGGVPEKVRDRSVGLTVDDPAEIAMPTAGTAFGIMSASSAPAAAAAGGVASAALAG